MCDTIGIINNTKSLFGKNSDRSPNEPQVIEYIPGYETSVTTKKITYIQIEEVKRVNSILISRPSWIWGAEMGVNEHGVCIGNEAVFTHGNYKKDGIIGMDLVRLALERASSAKEATAVIIDLITRYNQGGNCGYDSKFYYNNSFLIMDRTNLYILETAGKNWKIKEKKKASISNCITLNEDEIDSKSEKSIKENKIVTFFSGAKERLNCTTGVLDNITDIKDMFKILRTHKNGKNNSIFGHGSMKSPCMHADVLAINQTTSSMVVEIGEEIVVWFTATSLPCVSLFKPWKFKDKVEYPICVNEINTSYWYSREKIIRNTLGFKIPKEYYKQRDELEDELVKNFDKYSLKDIIQKEDGLYRSLEENLKRDKLCITTKLYWKIKNKTFFKEAKI